MAVELEVIKVDGETIKTSRKEWTYFKKTELEDIKAQLEAELIKVNSLLAKLTL